jgi:hypothetical protein
MLPNDEVYKKWLKNCEERIREYSKGIRKNDIEWLTQNILKQDPELADYETNLKSRVYLLDQLASALNIIQHNHPADIRTFVEKKRKEDGYDEALRGLMHDAGLLRIGDAKKCDGIEQKLNALLKKADKDFPDYSSKRERPISELRGDLIAVRTKGKMGSARMLTQLLGQRLKMEMDAEKAGQKK